MSDIDKINRMKTLIAELNKASKAYYGGGDEVMSDFEWNEKFDELTALEEITGIVLDDSPTHKVSGEASNRDDYDTEHEYSALSLPKSKSVDDVIKWCGFQVIALSWKLDGMTLVVTYDNGKLTKIATRGDGIKGYDITHLHAAIDGIPPTIEYKGHMVIRGEAVIPYSKFDVVNAKYGGIYKNPRNLVAGSLTHTLKSVTDIMDRGITFVPFTLVYIDTYILCQENWEEFGSWAFRMCYLKALGFTPVDFEILQAESFNDGAVIREAISRWSDKVNDVDYPVDGLVVTYDDVAYASQGVDGTHHNTRGGFAFKWADEDAETTLIDIEWSPSVNSINPVAIFEAVELEGTTVKRASLCNISEMERLGIGDVGTKLHVIKANKIIPKVVSACVPEGVDTFFDIPKVCPVCGHPTNVALSESGVKVLICTNKNCAAKHLSRFERFVGKHGFDIDGLSESTLAKLMEYGMVHSFEDILTIADRESELREKVLGQQGWGEKSITNLCVAVNKAKTVNAENFIYSLCIPMCGRDMAKRLASKYTVADLIALASKDAKEGTTQILADCEGIGDVKANEFIAWFADDENVALATKLLSMCNVIEQVKQQMTVTGRCSGLTFVVTGKLQDFKSRDDFQLYVENEGGRMASSVSKNVDFLVNNDLESQSSKNVTAKKLGIPIISEAEFISKFRS